MKNILKILNMNKYNDKKVQKYLVIFSFLISVLLGMLITYNFDFTKNVNLLFDSDTSRVISDMTEIKANHYRLSVHPLFVLFVQPIIFLLRGITQSNMLSLVIFSSLITSLTILFLYKLIGLFTKDNNIKVLTCLTYMFTFSNIVFTSGIEIYNVAALFLVILWYYTLKKLKQNRFDKNTLIILSILGLLQLSFTITNFIIFLIIIGLLFITRKITLKKAIMIPLMSVVLLIGLSGFQYIVWHNTPKVWEQSYKEETEFQDSKTIPDSIKNVIKGDYLNSVLGGEIDVNVVGGYEVEYANYILQFNKISIINLLILGLFYINLGILVLRNMKKNFFINGTIILGILFNTILHMVYGNSSTFLYSLHFMYLIFMLYGINISIDRDRKVRKYSLITLIILLISELLINTIKFNSLLSIIRNVLDKTFIYRSLGLIKTTIIYIILILVTASLIYLIIRLIKNIKLEKNNDRRIIKFSILVLLILLVEGIFIGLDNTESYSKLFIKKIDYIEDLPKYTKLDLMEDSFKTYFSKEIESFNEYVEEYNNLKKEYNTEETNAINYDDFYLFGMGNRRKIVFRNYSLIDVESGEYIDMFDIKNYLIIPNEYSVIIETKNNEYIKIYEDNLGVHKKVGDNDQIIEGTNVEINLYNFDNQKYKNTKKVLYSEILFNIKNSTIYPNIFVYDKPWYRDGALTTMVLEQTNNTNLISEWVNSIEDIYDRQNAGNEEADNLGELLYIISSQENVNWDLVNRIEEEAKRIAESNPNGYYIYGKTDFQDMHLYQNLWYKLGIERLGKEFTFDISNLNDYYSETAWWSSEKRINSLYDTNHAYPYLTTANRHTAGSGKIVLNKYIYPLSWEENASQANYDGIKIVSYRYSENKISPLHTWSASELLLFLMDETNDLK